MKENEKAQHKKKQLQEVRREWKRGQEMEAEGCMELKKGLAQL